jgi:selenocysteine lyase/cysteine desulfurase
VNTLKIGAFSAGSNITGILFDVDRLAVMCHKANFLACFDYAAAGPYIDINMAGATNTLGVFPKLTEEDKKYAYKDALYVSPHKFVGGPGSSGVLLARNAIIGSSKPQRLGGGIVFFVNESEHEFIADKQEREESGTPGVVQDIRAGLVFQLKEQVSPEHIHSLEM